MIHPVFLVEDDQDLRDVMAELLTADGYTVVTAGTAEDAIKQLNDGLRPSVVLVDLHLPRASGWEVLRYLDNEPHLRSVPAILMSGMPKDDVRNLADAVFKKPVDINNLLATIRTFATRAPAEP